MNSTEPCAKHPLSEEYESGPYVTLICNGLLILSPMKSHCEIRVLTSVPAHRSDIQIITRTKSSGHLAVEMLRFDKDLELQVTAPPKGAQQVQYYQQATAFTRNRRKDDLQDFRWIPDLEGNLFYGPHLNGARLQGKSQALTPTLRVHHGLFYTHSLTEDDFMVFNADSGKNVGDPVAIPFGMAARVYLSADSNSVVKIGDRTITAPEMDQEKFILVQNLCPECPEPEEPDFNLFFDALSLEGLPALRLMDPVNTNSTRLPCTQALLGGGMF